MMTGLPEIFSKISGRPVIIDVLDSLFMLVDTVKCPVPYQHLWRLRVIDLKIDHLNRILYEAVDIEVILGVKKTGDEIILKRNTNSQWPCLFRWVNLLV